MVLIYKEDNELNVEELEQDVQEIKRVKQQQEQLEQTVKPVKEKIKQQLSREDINKWIQTQ